MEIDYVDDVVHVELSGQRIPFPPGTISKRDLQTQLPPQVYPELWSHFVFPGDVVLDCGAYIGITAIQFHLLGAEVHAFEGSPRNQPRLRKACEPYPIRIHPVALSDKEEVVVTKFNDCIDREHPPQKIQYVVYDDYAAAVGIPDPSFVKMDIEGMETIAIKGMRRLLTEVRPVWQIEYHNDLPFVYDGFPGFVKKENGGFDFNVFKSLGYSVRDVQLKEISPQDMQNLQQYLFVPEIRML